MTPLEMLEAPVREKTVRPVKKTENLTDKARRMVKNELILNLYFDLCESVQEPHPKLKYSEGEKENMITSAELEEMKGYIAKAFGVAPTAQETFFNRVYSLSSNYGAVFEESDKEDF